jgi:magnesium-transporting ATPase (P-type)
LAKAQTMVLVTIILFEMFAAFNCRSTRYSIFKLGWFSNKWLVLAVLSSIFLMALVLYVPPLAFLFHTVPLGLPDWIVALLISSSALVFVELYKLIWERRHAGANSSLRDRRHGVPSVGE